MLGPLHTVVETPTYLRDAGKAGMTDVERQAAIDQIATDPIQGDEIQGSGGVRKVRLAGRGKGKSGGYRIMVAYVDIDTPVYLLAVLSKGDRENFETAEIAQMKTFTSGIKRTRKRRVRA